MTTERSVRRFSEADLARLREQREIRIETQAGEDDPVHLTVIWVVVGADDRAMVRSYLGPEARWYREAVASRRARLHLDHHAIAVHVEPVDDEDLIAACSDGFLRKYADSSSAQAMVADGVLHTTLELTRA